MVERLIDIIEIVGGTCKDFSGTKKYVSTGAVLDNAINECEVEIVSYNNRPSRANLVVTEGAILFAKMQNTRKTLLVDKDIAKYIFSTGFYAVKPKKKYISCELLFHYLNSTIFLKEKDKYCSGATQKSLNNDGLSKIIVKVPDTSVQERLCNSLNVISNLIKEKNKQVALLDNLIKARFVELFYDKGYPVLKWNDVFDTTTGKLDSNVSIDSGKYPFFTCSKEVLRIDKYAFEQEALLLAGNNATGKYDVKYYNGKFNAYQRTYVLGLKKDWSYRLFQYQLQDKLAHLKQQSLGGLTKYLTLKILGELEFIIPPKEEQGQFADFVKQIDKSKLAIQNSLDKLEQLKEALMQEYFG